MVELETDFLFDNQWNTSPTATSENGLRVFDWSEAIYPNKRIKEGMWLDQTEEMKEIRHNTYKCGFCGKNHYKPNYDFCVACIGSAYLEKKELPLLRLKRIDAGFSVKREKLTEEERSSLVALYHHEQIKTTKKNNEIERNRLVKKIQKKRESAETEYQGFMWLLEQDLNVSNCIYYDHTDRFCFGWRKPIDSETASELLDVLTEFPFRYQIKTDKKTTYENY
jgi:hypothetical protein